MTLTKQQRTVLADLQIQSMMFDMDIDWETATLVPKSDYKEAVWLTRWREKLNNSDWTVIDNGY